VTCFSSYRWPCPRPTAASRSVNPSHLALQGTFKRRLPPASLQAEYAGERIQNNILFIFILFYEYSNLEYVHIHVIYRVNQAEYGIRILLAASQEYVKPYLTYKPASRVHGRGRIHTLLFVVHRWPCPRPTAASLSVRSTRDPAGSSHQATSGTVGRFYIYMYIHMYSIYMYVYYYYYYYFYYYF